MTTQPSMRVAADRESIPDYLRDVASWPSVDPSALSDTERAVFYARQQAISLFLTEPGMTMRAIQLSTGVDPKTVYRIIERCLSKHTDGQIFGFRGAIPYARLKAYERVRGINNAAAAKGVGLSGAFGLLLERYPSLEQFLLKQAKMRHKPINGVPREVRKSIKRIHKGFLDECRKAGIRTHEYPLNQAMAGLRSLAEYFRRYDERTFESAARSRTAMRVPPGAPEHMDQAPPATRAFEVVEFDGHKIDLRVSLRITDPHGFQDLVELTKIWILVLIDIASRAVIGYRLAISQEYNKDDVAAAFQAALVPFRPREYKIPGLTIREGGGFPSSVFPQTQYACWEWLRFDGAKAHLSVDTVARLTHIVGCWPDNGPSREPDKRPFIERFFSLIAENFAHRLPGTTGSDPTSIQRALSDPKGDLSLLVELEELEDMIEVTVADYNGQVHGTINRTPLEAMGQLLAREKGYLRTLPAVVRQNLCLLQEARVVTIHGSLQQRVRPHVNFLNVKYTSKILSSNPALIGKKLRIYYDVRDIRTVKAFFEDGAELGMLTAAHPWCYTPHSVRVRREISRLVRLGKLKYREGDDPIEAWEKMKRGNAKKDKRAATALAKAHTQSRELSPKLPLPESAAGAPRQAPPAAQQVPDAAEQGDSPIDPPAPQPKTLRIKRTITF
ncbi:hypothetical protein [Herbaspirillum aquaticum]|uniref:hypothetical protein n=1 Tax=Herbaspirillum aquaticum TaxID=568783 RepID=UPI0024DE6B53|nr:hypothetical protein [Herbaspirillum aquaticum]